MHSHGDGGWARDYFALCLIVLIAFLFRSISFLMGTLYASMSGIVQVLVDLVKGFRLTDLFG
jgi:hypothetical protein